MLEGWLSCSGKQTQVEAAHNHLKFHFQGIQCPHLVYMGLSYTCGAHTCKKKHIQIR